VLLLALSYPWPTIASRVTRSGATGAAEQPAASLARTRAPRIVLLATFLAGALVSWASPLRSYTLAHHRHGPTAAAVTPQPLPDSLARVLDGLRPGARVGAWEVRSVSAAPVGARLDLANGPRLLHVLVVPRGTVPGDPPASTRRYDVLYEMSHPGETPVPDADRTAALDGVARSIEQRE
jgi:hypothetical protein